jgi:hypothetical protein
LPFVVPVGQIAPSDDSRRLRSMTAVGFGGGGLEASQPAHAKRERVLTGLCLAGHPRG